MNKIDQISQELGFAMGMATVLAKDAQLPPVEPATMATGFGFLVTKIAQLHERIEALEAAAKGG